MKIKEKDIKQFINTLNDKVYDTDSIITDFNNNNFDISKDDITDYQYRYQVYNNWLNGNKKTARNIFIINNLSIYDLQDIMPPSQLIDFVNFVMNRGKK